MEIAVSTLAEQREGEIVDVTGVVGAVDGTLLRLFEMGLTRGATVTVTRRAPLGDPLEIAVRGTRLCLRRHDARRFVVEKAAP
jgi:ferrous iron transport protein A